MDDENTVKQTAPGPARRDEIFLYVAISADSQLCDTLNY